MTYPDRGVTCDVMHGGLVPLFPIAGFEGSLGDYIEALWWQYRAMVHDPGMVIGGRRLLAVARQTPDGRDSTFWHLITHDWPKGRRLSLERCSYLPRVWHLLELFGQQDPRVVWWREREGKRYKLYVAPLDLHMVVVLRENRDTLVLLSAHRTHTLRQFERASAAWESGRCARPPAARHPLWHFRREAS